MRILSYMLVVMALVVGSTHASTIVYEQPGNPLPYVCPCWISDTADGTSGWQAFDNVALARPHAIHQISWQGIYLDGNDDNNPVTADTTQWEIGFWSDNSGRPGNLLFSETKSATDVETTFIGLGRFGGTTILNPISLYEFDFLLSSPFLTAAETTYWVSALSTSPTTFNPWFGFSKGNGGDGKAFQKSLSIGSGFVRNNDLSFALHISNVPAPSTLALFALGLAGLGFARRRLH